MALKVNRPWKTLEPKFELFGMNETFALSLTISILRRCAAKTASFGRSKPRHNLPRIFNSM